MEQSRDDSFWWVWKLHIGFQGTRVVQCRFTREEFQFVTSDPINLGDFEPEMRGFDLTGGRVHEIEGIVPDLLVLLVAGLVDEPSHQPTVIDEDYGIVGGIILLLTT